MMQSEGEKVSEKRYEVVKLSRGVGNKQVTGLILDTMIPLEAQQRVERENNNLTREEKGKTEFRVRVASANRAQLGI